jgi:chromosome segregation ATPase
VTPTEPDDHSPERELAATVEKLRLTEEKVLALRRDLDRSRKAMCGVESDARDLGHELCQCQTKLRESTDERRAMETQFDERLRLSSAELESLRAQVEASQLKYSQATSLSTALQNRVDELEDQITTLKGSRNRHSTTAINANPSLRIAEEASRLPHTHGQADSSTAIGDFHLQFSTYYD